MSTFTVYHATRKGSGDRIINDGYWIDRSGPALYGHGTYFWEKYDDAVEYGKVCFGDDGYEIMDQKIEVNSRNSVTYDRRKARGSPGDIASGLLARGIEVMIIPNPLIESSTMRSAKGRAYCCLIEL